jgi:monoamine oxidase
MICRRVEGYDAADATRFSSFALREEFTDENAWVQKNLEEGYGALIRYLERRCREHGVELLLAHEVTTIEHDGAATVHCKNGASFSASRAIVTVPLPLLSAIRYKPAIEEKLAVIPQVGFGPVIKTLIRFKTRWWTGERLNKFSRVFFLFSDERIPTWWTQYPKTHATLTGWIGGPRAHELAKFSDEELFEIGLQSLSNIFSIGMDELRQDALVWKVNNWEKDSYARGAYSYTTPESEEALKMLGEPIAHALYFAGEAFGADANATVEGALRSGAEVAARILAD